MSGWGGGYYGDGGPLPPESARIKGLEHSNRVLRDELYKDRKKALRAFWRGTAFGGLVIGAIFIATGAFSHGWYDPACCSDQDCAPIPESAITWTESGWRVELRPGDHFMVQSHAVLETVPFDEVLPSQDDQWHVCLRTEKAPAERVICLYIPEGRFGS